jgi:hypothetical protein
MPTVSSRPAASQVRLFIYNLDWVARHSRQMTTAGGSRSRYRPNLRGSFDSVAAEALSSDGPPGLGLTEGRVGG